MKKKKINVDDLKNIGSGWSLSNIHCPYSLIQSGAIILSKKEANYLISVGFINVCEGENNLRGLCLADYLHIQLILSNAGFECTEQS